MGSKVAPDEDMDASTINSQTFKLTRTNSITKIAATSSEEVDQLVNNLPH